MIKKNELLPGKWLYCDTFFWNDGESLSHLLWDQNKYRETSIKTYLAVDYQDKKKQSCLDKKYVSGGNETLVGFHYGWLTVILIMAEKLSSYPEAYSTLPYAN